MTSAAPPFSHPRYVAGDALGAGAQGAVFRVASREEPSRALVAKLWKAGAFSRAALVAEFALLSRLRVPGLVRAHDLAEDERTGAPFLIEDFVDGPDARAFVADAESDRARVARLGRVLADVATTLVGLHEGGFLHGDLKPAHVRFGPTGRATLLDLGAAVARGAERGQGASPGFAAPEILAGSAPSVASDLYGLGALAWAAASGAPPPPKRGRRSLRALAPWVPPSLADAIEALLAEHPADRPRAARDVLAALGVTELSRELGGAPAPIGRDRDLAALLARSETPGVRYLVAPAGFGKSHLLRELGTRALLAGRATRSFSFPLDDAVTHARLLAFLRGDDDAIAFGDTRAQTPLLLLDELHAAPLEVARALEARRCVTGTEPTIAILAATRDAIADAPRSTLERLDERALVSIARSFGTTSELEAERAASAAQGNAGWLLASLGRTPITKAAIEARASSLSAAGRDVLGAIAATSGAAREAWLSELLGERANEGLDAVLAASLALRRAHEGVTTYELSAPSLAADVAVAITLPATTLDALAEALLRDEGAPALALLSLARSDPPPARRAELLRRALASSRLAGLRELEIEASLALLADPDERSAELLRRLERLTRDAGASSSHPQVLSWLAALAERDARVAPLAARRQAEMAARRGDYDEAARLAEESGRLAHVVGDAGGVALAKAARGLVSLYRARWAEALELLREARAEARAAEVDDPEELARLDHNLGVVAIYRASFDEAISAFERAFATKQRLGDPGGMRACLRNLGYALTKAGRFEEAERALDDAISLARSLGQVAGRAWCLAARADVAVRRNHAEEAARFVAEAAALGDDVPAPVRADLAISRAEIRLLEGDGAGALAALGTVDESLRAEDAFVDARVDLVSSHAHLATLPVDRVAAARAAIRALRRATSAGLPELSADATTALRAARARPRVLAAPVRYPSPMRDAPDDTWRWLARVGAGEGFDSLTTALLATFVARTGAERAFFVVADAGEIVSARGVDLDGLAIAEAEKRVPAPAVKLAWESATPVYQPETPGPAGTGSRIAVAAGSPTSNRRAILIAEHRFAAARFDRVTDEELARWAALAGIALRIEPSVGAVRGAAAPSAADAESRADVTTVQPLLAPRRAFPSIVGKSPALLRALAKLEAAIDSDLPALIVGETGSGKELFARAIHEHGARAAAPFVPVNCAAIADSLFEAELFGHARGAFTGAERARGGLFARAEGGTLFLDEIGELSLPRQASLLRVLESQRYRPVGSDEERVSRARVVAATNRELAEAVSEGRFRQDLLFRLNVLSVRVPPLRERPTDVPLLARRLLEAAGSRAKLTARAEQALLAYSWPGNVRELSHVLARLATSELPRIELAHLPREIRAATQRAEPASETEELRDALTSSGGNISRAAKSLGLTRHGLKKRMVRLGIRAAAKDEDDDASLRGRPPRRVGAGFVRRRRRRATPRLGERSSLGRPCFGRRRHENHARRRRRSPWR